jgi:DNA-directed RNA polymerase I subunit RPA12
MARLNYFCATFSQLLHNINQDIQGAIIAMSAIGPLVFCTDCGNLLDGSTGNANTVLICDCCGAQNKGTRLGIGYGRFAKFVLDTSSKTVVTKTKASAFPSQLRQKRSTVQTVERADRIVEARIAQTCPECKNPEMKYYSVQLRSADEGSTVFYTCEKCGHK